MSSMERVELTSAGVRLVGDLRVPAGDGPHAAIVFTGPLSGVKEQVAGHYAERLGDAGFVTLAFDHRNFGESGGEPRQHEDPAGKLADLGDAVSFLQGRPEVDPDRIACCGICLGGGYALRFSAFDPRIKAVAGIAGGYNDPRAMRDGMGGEAYREMLATHAGIARRQAETGEVEYWAAVETADDDRPAVMGGTEPAEYYATDRSTSPGWTNHLTALSVRELVTTDLAGGADFISPTPFLVVHGRTDDYCTPANATNVYERAGDPKEIMWLDTTNHIDLYDQPQYVEPAVGATVEWFRRWLG